MKLIESDREWKAFFYGTILGIFAGISIGLLMVLSFLI